MPSKNTNYPTQKLHNNGLYMVLGQRIWQAISGLITVVILTNYLSPIEQGWYYSFLSLASCYVIFDFGLSSALIQITSYLFLGQKWGHFGLIHGEKSNHIFHLASQISKFYFILFFLFIIVMLPLGFWLFENKSNADLMAWRMPWIFMVFASAFSMITLPFSSIYEGSGEIETIYKVRIFQGILSSAASWILIFYGLGLWAASALTMMNALVFLLWFLSCKPMFIREMLSKKKHNNKWLNEIWPMHWRVGISWLSTFFFTTTFVPILFYFHGPVMAGQMGLSLALINMLGLIAQSWVTYRVPEMAKAAASKNWILLDRVFIKNFIISIAFYILGAFVLILIYSELSSTPYIARVLKKSSFIMLLSIVFMNHIVTSISSQLRSYKQEPLAKVSFLGTFAAVPLMILYAPQYADLGVTSVVLFIQIIFIIPVTLYLWKKYNIVWRK